MKLFTNTFIATHMRMKMKIDSSVYAFLEELNQLMKKHNINLDSDMTHIRHGYNYIGCLAQQTNSLELYISEDDHEPHYTTKEVL